MNLNIFSMPHCSQLEPSELFLVHLNYLLQILKKESLTTIKTLSPEYMGNICTVHSTMTVILGETWQNF